MPFFLQNHALQAGLRKYVYKRLILNVHFKSWGGGSTTHS